MGIRNCMTSSLFCAVPAWLWYHLFWETPPTSSDSYPKKGALFILCQLIWVSYPLPISFFCIQTTILLVYSSNTRQLPNMSLAHTPDKCHYVNKCVIQSSNGTWVSVFLVFFSCYSYQKEREGGGREAGRQGGGEGERDGEGGKTKHAINQRFSNLVCSLLK